MRAIAEFAASEHGRAFARIEEHFGRDPAASLEILDDVLAYNLRAALVVARAAEIEEEPLGAKARRAGEMVRRG